MFTVAARTLGYRVTVLDPDPLSPAAEFATGHLNTAYTHPVSLAELAQTCAAVTTEFENAPAEALLALAEKTVVRPSGNAVAVAQDRSREKGFIAAHGLPVGPWADVRSEADFDAALGKVRLPAILKTARFGYDGKGQAAIASRADLERVFAEWKRVPCVLEERLALDLEVSVILARAADGSVAVFPVAENRHARGILDLTIAPARIPAALAAEAMALATRLANALDYVGVLAAEMFVVPNGKGAQVLVNEIAPRVHNSGHWTLDGASISQFEQHIRAIAGWPLGKPVRHGRVTMTNLIGDDVNDYERWLTVPGATVHLYGKGPARPGRKMGHVTQVMPDRPKNG